MLSNRVPLSQTLVVPKRFPHCCSRMGRSLSSARFAVEKDKKLRAFIRANHKVETVFKNIQSALFHAEAPRVDVFVAGFPCQPFSDAGQGFGTADVRGKIIYDIVKYVKVRLPTAFLLENVSGLVHRHPNTFEHILLLLNDIRDKRGQPMYTVNWKLLNSNVVGYVPQSRNRVYIVGVLKNAQTEPFKWPSLVTPPGLSELLDPVPATPLALPKSSLATSKLKAAYAQARSAGADPSSQCIVVNCDARSCSWNVDSTPCLTADRGASRGFWISSRGGRMTVAELCRLQGMDPITNSAGLTDRQLGYAVGNSFTQTVIARVLAQLLYSAGLTDHVVDPWLTLGRAARRRAAKRSRT